MPAVFSAQLQNSNQFRTEMRDFFSIVEESAPFTPHPFAGARIEREPVEAGNNRTTTIRYDHLLVCISDLDGPQSALVLLADLVESLECVPLIRRLAVILTTIILFNAIADDDAQLSVQLEPAVEMCIRDSC